MKNTFKNISRFALGGVAIALLTSVRLAPATATPFHPMVTLKSVSLSAGVLVAGGGHDDGQESHGDKGKKGG